MGFVPTLPSETLRWLIVFKTGWTLEQVDALSQQDYTEFFAIRDGAVKSKIWDRL